MTTKKQSRLSTDRHCRFALRTWTVEQWKQYVDILAVIRVNLFQIWSMAGILPTPCSAKPG